MLGFGGFEIDDGEAGEELVQSLAVGLGAQAFEAADEELSSDDLGDGYLLGEQGLQAVPNGGRPTAEKEDDGAGIQMVEVEGHAERDLVESLSFGIGGGGQVRRLAEGVVFD